MKPKRERKRAINAWNRGFERRAKERGQRIVTARLGPVAYAKLRSICDVHNCTVRDVIEGFLFGNLTIRHSQLVQEHGFSRQEAEVFLSEQ